MATKISKPIDGITYNDIIDVVVTTDDTDATKIELYIDGDKVLDDTSEPYLFNYDTSRLVDGRHEVKAISNGTGAEATKVIIETRNGQIEKHTVLYASSIILMLIVLWWTYRIIRGKNR